MGREELEEWASRYEAAAQLPRLVRRLLLATSPLDAIEMRGGSGVRLEGWDGIVRARAATAFCPVGLSVWEFSIEAKVRTKLDKDYEKRTQKPPGGVRPSLATYVAVTARAFSKKKAEWASEKRAEGRWADVRVLDVDDLAMWLEQAPAVARWFANLRGRPGYEGQDVEAFLAAWRARTSPPLPHALVLAGEDRRARSDELLAALVEPSRPELGKAAGRTLLVRGRTREEALLFAAATVARNERLAARALIAETPEAYRWALRVQAAERPIVLPNFEAPEVGEGGASRASVILSGDRSAPVKAGATLTLEEQPWPALIAVLQEAGWSEPEGEQLIRSAGGSLETLQRRCGYVAITLPEWAKASPRGELFALLLAGAWAPRVLGDQAAIRRLGGDPVVADQISMEFASRDVMKRVTEQFSHPDRVRRTARAFRS